VIFVTVGAQMPFDRLVRAVDGWAGRNGKTDVFAQIGPTGYRPASISWTRFLEPAEFREKIAASRLVIAHAGMGSILSALEHAKPIIVMPRRGDLRETRNDHQLATVRRFGAKPGITVAEDERHLLACLDQGTTEAALEPLGPHAENRLIETIRSFINTDRSSR